MASYTSVQAKLVTILGTKAGAGQFFAEVHDFPNPEPTKFPCVMPIAKDGNEEIFDTAENESEYRFIVRGFIIDENDKATYDKLLLAIDTVLSLLRKDDYMTLEGTVHKFLPQGKVALFRTKQSKYNVVGFDIECVAKALNPITL